MKSVNIFIFCYALLVSVLSIKAAELPQYVIDDIKASNMTLELQSYAADESNISQAYWMQWHVNLAANSSFFYFLTELFSMNSTGFATLVNQPNNSSINPLQGSLSNPYGKGQIMRIIQFLLRNGAR